MEHEVLLEKKSHRKICADCQLKLQLLEARYEGQLEYDRILEKEFSNDKYNFKEGMLPITEKNTKLVLSLPMFAEITEEERARVNDLMKKLGL